MNLYKKECEGNDAIITYSGRDGIIASILNKTLDLKYFEKIMARGISLILFDQGDDNLEVDYIGINDYKSSQIFVDHLVEQGCKRIAHI
jgi:LacI family transcriptional regulator